MKEAQVACEATLLFHKAMHIFVLSPFFLAALVSWVAKNLKNAKPVPAPAFKK